MNSTKLRSPDKFDPESVGTVVQSELDEVLYISQTSDSATETTSRTKEDLQAATAPSFLMSDPSIQKIDLRILFQADNWTTKLHRERYSQWAVRIGFINAVGKVIPDAWLPGIGKPLPQVQDSADPVHSGKRAGVPSRKRNQVHDPVQR